jgi:hypothetical protein
VRENEGIFVQNYLAFFVDLILAVTPSQIPTCLPTKSYLPLKAEALDRLLIFDIPI